MTEIHHSSDWSQRMQHRLAHRREQKLFRARSTIRPVSATHIEIDGVELLQFASNDYLSLAWSPSVRQAVREAIEQWPCGAGASPLITGRGPWMNDLESSLAKFERAESALVFGSGYAANVGVIDALVDRDDVLFSDALNHASLIDGCRLSRAPTYIFEHSNTSHLEALLKWHRHEGDLAFIVTDSVFSMDGDEAPLDILVDLAARYDAQLIVDEAHATGVLGENGRGLFEKRNLPATRAVRIATLSKAVGAVGGFVAGSELLIDYLRNFARPYIYSTAMPPTSAIAARVALEQIPSLTAERAWLASASKSLRQELRSDGWTVPDGETPIVPVFLPSIEFGQSLSLWLRKNGIFLPFIRPPTVPEGKQMLRISLNKSHSREDLTKLRVALNRFKSSEAIDA